VNRRQFLHKLGLGTVSSSIAVLGQSAFPNLLVSAKHSFDSGAGACAVQNLSAKTMAMLAKIQTLNTEFPIIGIYHKPNDQDRQSAGSGMGLYPCNGQLPCLELDARSEQVYPPFIMATRRQTDSLVRQAYLLLPESIRRSTAFVIADRLLQFPDCYLPYLRAKRQVVLVGSFFGLGAINAATDYANSENGYGVRSFHRLQLRQLEYALDLIQSLDKPIIDVIYGMGDSNTDYAIQVRAQLQQQSQILLQRSGLSPRLFVLDWGADELIFKAFARRLPPLKLKLILANPSARHHYDANQTTAAILERTLQTLNLKTTAGENYDAQVFIFDRHPSAPVDFNQVFAANDPQQAEFDQQFRRQLRAIAPARHPRTVIIDGRNPNGALNEACLPPSDQCLAFGSWGTFANGAGQTLAIAKLLIYAQNPVVQRQLLLEAVAHDVFCIGYAAAQERQSPFRQALTQQQLPYIHKDPPTYQLDQVTQVFKVMNQWVNQQMQASMPGSQNTEFVIIPQLWRTFESQVFVKDGPLAIAGVFRRDLPPEVFDPFTCVPGVRALTLQELVDTTWKGMKGEAKKPLF
jgi:hypothetical protein